MKWSQVPPTLWRCSQCDEQQFSKHKLDQSVCKKCLESKRKARFEAALAERQAARAVKQSVRAAEKSDMRSVIKSEARKRAAPWEGVGRRD